MAVWNCNGSLKLDVGVGAFKDNVKGRDIIFYLETHQAAGSTLPKVSGYYSVTAKRVSASVKRETRETPEECSGPAGRFMHHSTWRRMKCSFQSDIRSIGPHLDFEHQMLLSPFEEALTPYRLPYSVL